MTKKKRIITRLLVVLAALTLISCCFLGTTFARYTSSNSGKASVDVAKWDVDVTGAGANGSMDVTFAKLSPSAADYSTSAVRTNTTGKVKVATITSASDVDAKITITTDAVKFYDNASTPKEITSTYTDDTTLLGKAQSVLTVKLYYTTVAAPTQDSDYTEMKVDETTPANSTNNFVIVGKSSTTAAATRVFAKGTSVYIYAEAVWTSQDTATQNGDEIDTAVGEKVSKMEVTVNYVAVQNTKLPE